MQEPAKRFINTMDTLKLPSQHQINDRIWFRLWSADVIGEIKAIHFYPDKVKYDLELFANDGQKTRIYNVDSCFVFSNIP